MLIFIRECLVCKDKQKAPKQSYIQLRTKRKESAFYSFHLITYTASSFMYRTAGCVRSYYVCIHTHTHPMDTHTHLYGKVSPASKQLALFHPTNKHLLNTYNVSMPVCVVGSRKQSNKHYRQNPCSCKACSGLGETYGR